jgi:hypothetical protein
MMRKTEPGSFVDCVESVMVRPVETVKPTDLLQYALKRIVKKNIGWPKSKDLCQDRLALAHDPDLAAI